MQADAALKGRRTAKGSGRGLERPAHGEGLKPLR